MGFGMAMRTAGVTRTAGVYDSRPAPASGPRGGSKCSTSYPPFATGWLLCCSSAGGGGGGGGCCAGAGVCDDACGTIAVVTASAVTRSISSFRLSSASY